MNMDMDALMCLPYFEPMRFRIQLRPRGRKARKGKKYKPQKVHQDAARTGIYNHISFDFEVMD